jgi:hypothetical protein
MRPSVLLPQWSHHQSFHYHLALSDDDGALKLIPPFSQEAPFDEIDNRFGKVSYCSFEKMSCWIEQMMSFGRLVKQQNGMYYEIKTEGYSRNAVLDTLVFMTVSYRNHSRNLKTG